MAYLAPELLSSLRTGMDFDPQPVDIWACGVWLAALLTGVLPWQADPRGSPAEQAEQTL